jgi:hypothetical protein
VPHHGKGQSEGDSLLVKLHIEENTGFQYRTTLKCFKVKADVALYVLSHKSFCMWIMIITQVGFEGCCVICAIKASGDSKTIPMRYAAQPVILKTIGVW